MDEWKRELKFQLRAAWSIAKNYPVSIMGIFLTGVFIGAVLG